MPRIQKIITNLGLFDIRQSGVGKMAHVARSLASTVTTAWNGSKTSTSYPLPSA
jgi:hypothetical protein